MKLPSTAILEDPTEITEQTGMGDRCSAGPAGNKRSLIWEYFERLDSSDAACCSICKRKLQCGEGGSTGNLWRHLLKRHQGVFSELTASGKHPPAPKPQQEPEKKPRDTERMKLPVEVSLDAEDPAVNISSLSEAAIDSILAPLQEDPTEMTEQMEMGDRCSAGRTRNKRSLIWKYFKRLSGLDAACCTICKRKLQCFESSGTSNLRRHMLKRHPKVFSELTANGNRPPALKPQQESEFNQEPEESYVTEHIKLPGPLKNSRPCDGEMRVLMQEKELIEALRRTQKEEARTLEHQRELMERLRAADAREAAAEREKLEMLKKAQQEEAEDLSRQREELQKEKAELQKKWEELRQEREDFLLLSK